MEPQLVNFICYDDDVEVGVWPMKVLPAPGDVITIEVEGEVTTWVARTISHHLGTKAETNGVVVEGFHQVDVVVQKVRAG